MAQHYYKEVEKRAYTRFTSGISVKFEIIRGSRTWIGRKYRSNTINVSGGGILINAVSLPAYTLADLIQQTAKLSIEIFLPEEEPIKAMGEVVWVTRDHRSEGNYGIGVKFTKISEHDRKRFVKYQQEHIYPC